MAAQRSTSYPSITILKSIDFVKQIYANFGTTHFASREEISKTLKKAEPTIQQPSSTSVQYGLLDLKYGEGYKPSQLFLKIFKPLSETEKNDALLEAFKKPNLYSSLLDEFLNQFIPTNEGLSTVLYRKYGISDNVSRKVADLFLENASDLGLLDGEHYLRIGTVTPTEVKPNEATPVLPVLVQSEKESHNINSSTSQSYSSELEPTLNSQYNTFNIPLKQRKRAQVIIPHDIQRDDFETIIKWVYLMKESYE